MPERVRIAFERQIILVPLQNLLPTKIIPAHVRQTQKYRRVINSVTQIGLIEPLSVARQNDGNYLIVDGHVRLEGLKQSQCTEARCVVADDDESFTYNKRVNRPPPIQEHYMIVNALNRGVSEDFLAKSLDMDIKLIRARRHLLAGITSDVADLLKDKPVSHTTFSKMRKMKAIRQLEVAELMVSANNFTLTYASALLATTKPEELHKPEDIKKATGLTSEQMARLEREMSGISQAYKEMEATYGDDMLDLVVTGGYLEKLLSRPHIEAFLQSRYPEFIDQFRTIVAAASLDQPMAAQ